MNTKPRRSPQPPIPAEVIVPGAEFVKNRARDVGQPPIVVVVESVTMDTSPPTVFYRYKHNDKHRNMPLDSFRQGSEHRLPDPAVVDPADEAPLSGERVAQAGTLEEQVFRLTLESAEHTKMLTEALTLLRRLVPRGQLELGVAR